MPYIPPRRFRPARYRPLRNRRDGGGTRFDDEAPPNYTPPATTGVVGGRDYRRTATATQPVTATAAAPEADTRPWYQRLANDVMRLIAQGAAPLVGAGTGAVAGLTGNLQRGAQTGDYRGILGDVLRGGAEGTRQLGGYALGNEPETLGASSENVGPELRNFLGFPDPSRGLFESGGGPGGYTDILGLGFDPTTNFGALYEGQGEGFVPGSQSRGIYPTEETYDVLSQRRAEDAAGYYQTLGAPAPSFDGGGGGGGFGGFNFGPGSPADPSFWLQMLRWLI